MMDSEYLYPALNLLGILVLIFILMYLFKRFKQAKDAKNSMIKIINTVAVGTKEKIILMEVNHSMLLIGATPNHIETLYVFNDESEKSMASDCENLKGVFSSKMENIDSQ